MSDLSDDEFEQLASAQTDLAAISPTPLPPTPLSQPALNGMTDDEFEAMASASASEPIAEPAPMDPLDQIALNDERARLEQEALQAEHGGLGSQALAGLEGFGRGVTLGLSDVAAEGASGLAAALGGPDVERAAGPGLDAPLSDENVFTLAYKQARADIQARREANPVTAGLSEVVGAVAPTLLSGGGTALARVAGAAPANLVNRAGLAAAGRVAGAAPGILRAAGAGLVGGAVEGGLAAGALAASEVVPEVIQDPGLAAEHILTATSEGALIGGVFGGILGGSARALSRGGQALDDVGDKLATKPVQEGAAEVVPPQSLEDFDLSLRAVEERPAVTVANDLAMQDVRGKYAKAVEQRQAFEGKFADAIQDETRAISSKVDNILRGANNVDELAGVATKNSANRIAASGLDAMPSGQQQYRGVVKGRGKNAQPVMRELSERHVKARGVLSAMRDELDGYRAGLTDVESQGIGKAVKYFDQKSELIEDAFSRGDTGEAFVQLDDLKRGLGRMRANLPSQSQDIIEQIYPVIQQHLEDVGLYGPLAEMQRAINPKWAERISQSKDASWRQFTSVSGERAANEWDNLYLSNPESIKGLLSNVGDAGAVRTEEAFRKNLRAMARDAMERAKALGDERLQKQALQMVEDVSDVEKRLDTVARLRQDSIEGERAAQASSTADLAASTLGMVSPRLAFAVQGSAAAKQRIVAAAAEAGNDVAAKVAKNAAKLVRLANKGIAATARVAPRAAAVALAATESGAVQQLVSQRKVDQSIESANALMDPRSPQARELLETAAAVERDEPELADAMVSLQLRRAQLIQSLLPKPMPGLFAPAPQLDPMRGRKLQRTVSAAYYPERTLRRLADSTATKDEIDTIKALYPGLYQQFVASVEQELGSTRKVPSREDQQRIHAMTGLVVRPSLEPSAMVKQQQTAQAATAEQEAQEAAEKSSARNIKVDPDRYLSRADAITAR
jgi:hypothetical protein